MEKLKMKLVGEDGNIFAIIGRFQHTARRAGWEKGDIDKVVTEITNSKSYDEALIIILKYVEEPDDDEEI